MHRRGTGHDEIQHLARTRPPQSFRLKTRCGNMKELLLQILLGYGTDHDHSNHFLSSTRDLPILEALLDVMLGHFPI